jgi:hypothetical protein
MAQIIESHDVVGVGVCDDGCANQLCAFLGPVADAVPVRRQSQTRPGALTSTPVRVRRLRGLLEVQTRQLQPTTGTPMLVPVPITTISHGL